MSNNLKILIVGAGKMAIEYSKVLTKLNIEYDVLSRNTNSAYMFESITGKTVIKEKLATFLKKNNNYSAVINSVSVESLFKTTITLIKSRIKFILVEKPAAVNLYQLFYLNFLTLLFRKNVFVAYNRRFYDSINYFNKFIENKNEKILTCHFEFNEISSKISSNVKSIFLKKNWLIANSTHVLDLVIFLIGRPKIFSQLSKNKLDWHRKGLFVGSGITNKNILFSMNSNWITDGRWLIEIKTPNFKFIFQPLEEIKIISSERTDIIRFDTDLKHGLKNMVEYFVNIVSMESHNTKLVTIYEQLLNFKYYYKLH